MAPDDNQKDRSVQMGTHVKGGKSAQFRAIGVIRSALKSRSKAPKQGAEGAPDAWLEVSSFAAQGVDGILVGHDIIVVTWLHRARRDVLKVHPRSDWRRPLTGVFATRSPGRPKIRWAFIASPCAGSLRIGCGSAPSKPSTVRPSLTSNRCFLASKTSNDAFLRPEALLHSRPGSFQLGRYLRPSNGALFH
jgi:hypothetical protein